MLSRWETSVHFIVIYIYIKEDKTREGSLLLLLCMLLLVCLKHTHNILLEEKEEEECWANHH